ncbi:MAG: T9SS C-terminal target domain-containing protein [Cryomorphaceae bacterium]|nr:MAG: T9SS C-terminal target domain-containing protein [Cryomorphaceae bacterium]
MTCFLGLVFSAKLGYKPLPLRFNQTSELVNFAHMLNRHSTLLLAFILCFGVLKLCGQSSLLSSGNWHHFTTSSDGVYKLTFEDLEGLGVLSAPIASEYLRLFSHGPGMLPEQNWVPRPSDLREVAIYVGDGGDGHFEPGDYLLFYGSDQTTWTYHGADGIYRHSTNLYDDEVHFFLTTDHGYGLRVTQAPGQMVITEHVINQSPEPFLHKTYLRNLFSSGKKWFGENFYDVLTHDFVFQIPGAVAGSQGLCEVNVISRALGMGNTNTFEVQAAGTQSSFEVLNVTNNYLNDYVRAARHIFSFEVNGTLTPVSVTLDPFSSASAAWINFITLQVERHLVLHNQEQFLFRSPPSAPSDEVLEYRVANGNTETMVWDISSFAAPVRLSPALSYNGNMVFQRINDEARRFVCFNLNNTLSPHYLGILPNQNLKGQPFAEGFIVTHPDFLAQALQLAAFHESHNQLSVNVATTDEIYREFSGGAKDITAIKDYLRYFYNNAPSPEERPRYLCLLGDASFDYKGHVHPNSCFVPTFQSETSFALITTYCSDDYFVLLQPQKSNLLQESLDAGVGRLPAKSVEEAQAMVDKIIAYSQPENNGNWQYKVLIVADDEDNNIHMTQAEAIAENLENLNCALHLSKVYIDAYEQVSTPNGNRYPEASQEISKQLNAGQFMVNYTGHSGHSNWAAEQVLVDTTIEQLQNGTRLPFHFMANCDFSKFDAPQFVSGGERLMINPDGGAIACVSNARLGYSSSNFTFNNHFNNNLFTQYEDGYPRLGDLIRNAKNASLSSSIMSHRSINLLGDPMVRLKYADYYIEVSSLSDPNTGTELDELTGGTTIRLEGGIVDIDGLPASHFDGQLSYLVLDSRVPQITLGNDGFPPFEYSVHLDTLAHGVTDVMFGAFDFTVYLPQQGNGHPGEGKIILHASNQDQSALGCRMGFDVSDIFTRVYEKQAMQLSVFPNPTTDRITLRWSETQPNTQISCLNSNGQPVRTWGSTQGVSQEISLEGMPAGTYLLRVESPDALAVIKVIKLP